MRIKQNMLYKFRLLYKCCLPGLIASLILPVGSQSQSGSPSANYVFINHKQYEGLGDTRYAVRTDKSYSIDGSLVTGSPFLYDDWNPGVIKTPDGRVYPDQQIRYDAYNQKLNYRSGEESVEITEPIAEFSLQVRIGDKTNSLLFRSGNRYSRKSNNLFYEVLFEDAAGSLLKLNRKQVYQDITNVLDIKRKFLDLELSFFYYDAVSSQISKIKNDGSNFISILHGTPNEEQALRSAGLNFSLEEDRTEALRMIHKLRADQKIP